MDTLTRGKGGAALSVKGRKVAKAFVQNSDEMREKEMELKQTRRELVAAERRSVMYEKSSERAKEREREWEERCRRENELKKQAHRDKRKVQNALERSETQNKRLKGEAGSSMDRTMHSKLGPGLQLLLGSAQKQISQKQIS